LGIPCYRLVELRARGFPAYVDPGTERAVHLVLKVPLLGVIGIFKELRLHALTRGSNFAVEGGQVMWG
jgi:hypothetical protein